MCDSPVDRIVVRDRRAVAVRTRGEEVRATRAVLADVGAPSLYLDLVGAEHLSAKVVDDVGRFEWDNATVKVDWNLDRTDPVVVGAGTTRGHAAPGRQCRRAHRVELGARARARSRDAVPDHGPAVDDRSDAHAAGRGDGVGVLARAARDSRRRGAASSTSRRSIASGLERFADRMQREIEQLAPGFGDDRARRVT